MKNKNVAMTSFIGLIVIASLANLVNATTLSMTVPAGEEVNRKIDLAVDDRARMQFTVIGKENSFISFSLVCTNATKIDFGEISVLDHNFVCDAKGEYIMFFVNNDVTESKLVTLNYEVEHYLFGIPQTLFLVLLITLLCVAMIAVYILASPHLYARAQISLKR
jgi:hypothetical protein